MSLRLIKHELFLSCPCLCRWRDISVVSSKVHLPLLEAEWGGFSPWKHLNGVGRLGPFSHYSDKVWQEFNGVLWSVMEQLQQLNIATWSANALILERKNCYRGWDFHPCFDLCGSTRTDPQGVKMKTCEGGGQTIFFFNWDVLHGPGPSACLGILQVSEYLSFSTPKFNEPGQNNRADQTDAVTDQQL